MVLPLNKDGTNYIEDAQGLTLPVPVGSMALVPNDHNTIYVALGVGLEKILFSNTAFTSTVRCERERKRARRAR